VVTSTQADGLIELARRQRRQLSVFHQRRWDSDYLTVERCIRTGVLGRVTLYIARYDRFSTEPATHRWQEQHQPGAGLLYDLGPHLIDQAVHLFGLPETVMADIRAQRPGAVVDYFHLVLGYGQLRVVLHAGSVVRAPGPRFEVHGDAGSVVKHGLDGQIAALLAGGRPGDPGWGSEAEDRHGTARPTPGDLRCTADLPASAEPTSRSTSRWRPRSAAKGRYRCQPRTPGTRSG
jgi:scyllo-inositol 2-dehydrogenase (NADP+)